MYTVGEFRLHEKNINLKFHNFQVLSSQKNIFNFLYGNGQVSFMTLLQLNTSFNLVLFLRYAEPVLIQIYSYIYKNLHV